MLVRGDVPTDVAVSAIVLFNLTTMYVGIAAVVIGVPLTALLLDLPPDIARVVWIALGVLIVVAVALGVLLRRGLLPGAGRGVAGRRRVHRRASAQRRQRARSRVRTRLRGSHGLAHL